jgi:hypothetical protein
MLSNMKQNKFDIKNNNHFKIMEIIKLKISFQSIIFTTQKVSSNLLILIMH